MNVTRDVVTDLLPLYFSGEASEDTRRLVEDFFRENPDFERVARAAAKPLERLGYAPPAAPEAEKEKREMQRIGWELRSRRVWLYSAVLCTLWPLVPLVGGQLAAWVGGPHTLVGRVSYWCVAAFFWLLYITRPARLNVLLAGAIMVSAGETAAILIRLRVIPAPASQASNLGILALGLCAALCWFWYVRSRTTASR